VLNPADLVGYVRYFNAKLPKSRIFIRALRILYRIPGEKQMTQTTLSREQIEFYLENGYILASGLISDDITLRAEAKLWQELGITPDEPEGWKDAESLGWTEMSAEIRACYTPAFLRAAMQLAEGEPEPTFFQPRKRHSVIPIFPEDGEWSHHGPHIDHAIRSHGEKTFPFAFRIAAMTYLNDVEPHSGGTIVWPRSHRKIEALARSNPERYEYMWVLQEDLHLVDIGDPFELTPKRGDVLFFHHLCAHTGSKNIGKRPRFALNTKWERDVSRHHQ
jgi:hypothetical protein